MSEYSKLVDEFFTRYEEPYIEKLTVGFAGIDPPLRILASSIDHEGLNHLLGGDETGHYHLTKDQWEKVLELLDDEPAPTPPPEPEDWEIYDGGFASTSENEYNENSDHWLDGGYSPNDHESGVDGGKAA